MDEICEAVCRKIISAYKGQYGVFYEDELIEAIPGDENKTRETLEAALKTLVKGGYIDVKYARGSAFCMTGIKLYEAAAPADDCGEGADDEQPRNARIYAMMFILSLIGSVAGGILGGIIAHAF